jgi:hypothetical protein
MMKVKVVKTYSLLMTPLLNYIIDMMNQEILMKFTERPS